MSEYDGVYSMEEAFKGQYYYEVLGDTPKNLC